MFGFLCERRDVGKRGWGRTGQYEQRLRERIALDPYNGHIPGFALYKEGKSTSPISIYRECKACGTSDFFIENTDCPAKGEIGWIDVRREWLV